jgi:hypothetical protein
MRRFSVFAVCLLILSGLAVAQSSSVEPEPGIITASSPLYPVDVALDRVVKSDSGVAFERASEYSVAQESNDSEAEERAMRQLNNSIARVASSNETQGLEKAEAVLKQVRERTPDQANKGLDKALSNIGKARNGTLKPEDVGRPDDSEGRPEGSGRP